MRHPATMIFLPLLVIHALTPVLAQDMASTMYMDFRNQRIDDIIYSLAELCGQRVLVDETVTGTATFRFEDSGFESAIMRLADYCNLYVTMQDGVYTVSKVRIEQDDGQRLSVSAENVQVGQLLDLLSRRVNRTILYDALPSATVTIRTQGATLDDVLNLAIVKLPGFALERIADGYYITKTGGTLVRRNVDVLTLTESDGRFSMGIQSASFTGTMEALFRKAGREYALLARPSVQLEGMSYADKDFDALLSLILEQASCDYTVSDGIYYVYEVQKKDVVKGLKETRTILLHNISTETLASLLPPELGGQSFLRADKGSNTIVLTGSPSEIDPIEEFIRKMDVPLSGSGYRQFLLEHISARDAAALIPRTLLVSDIIILPSDDGLVTQVTEESGERLARFIDIIDSKNEFYHGDCFDGKNSVTDIKMTIERTTTWKTQATATGTCVVINTKTVPTLSAHVNGEAKAKKLKAEEIIRSYPNCRLLGE